ncbi:hypothetical protein [Saccharothrix variisporea]|uniref:hypothetical protein n=1 Tax=Saccharothrix variisporea TaxID=543527 RepID=UPI000EB12892|nr:hypothetical protein [Saccharothrix variisporea]
MLHLQARPEHLSSDKAWQVGRDEADLAVRTTLERFDIVEFFADVKEFESYEDVWAHELGDELLAEVTSGRNRRAVAFDMRARGQEFTRAAGRALVDIRDRTLTHDRGRRLRRHALNAS